VNYLLPVRKKLNLFMPLTEKTSMRMNNTPLGSKIERLEADISLLQKCEQIDKLEAQVELLEKAKARPSKAGKTVEQYLNSLDHSARWDNSEGANSPASSLSSEPGGEPDDEPDEPDDNTPAKKNHKFETVVRRIAAERGLPKAQALAAARKENPELYQSYQNSGVAKSYADLVAAEIQKGCSPTVARQRVEYAHPDLARASIAKSVRASEFMAGVDAIKKSQNCSRTAAMALARREHPEEFERFQNV
jgi:hypothetical protein